MRKEIELRDYFATSIDKDEYGDIIFRNLSRRASEILAGYPRPEEPTEAQCRLVPDLRSNWQIKCAEWEFAWRAALRFKYADAMLNARARQEQS